jgi:hypothetical protein
MAETKKHLFLTRTTYSIHHKTYKTCKTSIKTLAAPQPCRRREAAGWRASHTQQKVLRVLLVL